MSLIVSWVLFPLLLAALGLGWGALVEWVSGERTLGALAIPLGLAAVIVVTGLLTAFSASAPAAAPVAAVGAVVGLGRAWRRTKIAPAAGAAAVGVLAVVGAPVILSGQATFLGYVRLDDTATWLAFIDQFFSHGRSLGALPDSTFKLLLSTNLTGSGYPSGSFMVPGVGHWITGVDAAWLFQPYLAACAAALAICIWELIAPVIAGAWLRAFVAFIAAQSALLVGYAAWGGIKELTAAFLLALAVALAVRLLAAPRVRPRSTVAPAVAVAALIVSLGAGAAVYVAPLVLALNSVFVWRANVWRSRVGAVVAWDAILAANAGLAALAFQLVPRETLRFATARHTQEAGVALLLLDFVVLLWTPGIARSHPLVRRGVGALVVGGATALIVALGADGTPYVVLGGLMALAGLAVSSPASARRFFAGAGAPILGLPLTAILALPAWLTLSTYLRVNQVFASSTADHATLYGNLIRPLRALQLAGIWLYGDFRDSPSAPPTFWNHLLIWCVLVGAAIALAWTLWKRNLALALYVGVALAAVAILSVQHTGPWLMGKSLAISSPAVLLAGLAGGALLFALNRVATATAGVLLLGVVAGGVLWSNYLQYRDVTLAPRARMAELGHIGSMVGSKGPTFFNEYEIYGDRHFLRGGAPVEPAEYRSVNLPTLGNAILTKAAWANIDSFGLDTLAPYRSLVLRVGPTESRPSTLYQPVFAGRYYELWQQPAHPAERVVKHLPLGDSRNAAYCGAAQNVDVAANLCPVAPAGAAPCPAVMALARTARADHGELAAYERINPIVLRGTDSRWSAGWYVNAATKTLTPNAGGASASFSIRLAQPITNYQLWLGGSFDRGFDVTVDGREIGSVANALDPVGAYERIGSPLRLSRGTHEITVTYPGSSLAPGSADSENYTSLADLALSPPASSSRLVTVPPASASSLCGRSLDWLEVVAPA